MAKKTKNAGQAEYAHSVDLIAAARKLYPATMNVPMFAYHMGLDCCVADTTLFKEEQFAEFCKIVKLQKYKGKAIWAAAKKSADFGDNRTFSKLVRQ